MGAWEQAEGRIQDTVGSEALGAFRLERPLAAGLSQAKADSAAWKPSFFVIGPPRTGTSWLHEVLRDRVLLPHPSKETRFFDTHFQRGLKWYRAHYPAPQGERRVGEIGPTYFASKEARERIAKTFPDAKIVCIFRNPVERLISLYRVRRAYGLIAWSFEEALHRDEEMIESSRYAAHLRAWLDTMGDGQVLAAVYDDLRADPQQFLDRLVDFIRIPRFKLTDSQVRYVHGSDAMTHPRNHSRTQRAMAIAEWLKARRLDRVVAATRNSPLIRLFLGGGPKFGEMPLDITMRLYETFRPEVEQLEAILNRDLSSWKSLDGKQRMEFAS
jgi:hypothetical protein